MAIAELLDEIAFVEILIAVDAPSNCHVLSSSKYLLAKSTTTSMEGRDRVVGQLR